MRMPQIAQGDVHRVSPATDTGRSDGAHAVPSIATGIVSRRFRRATARIARPTTANTATVPRIMMIRITVAVLAVVGLVRAAARKNGGSRSRRDGGHGMSTIAAPRASPATR